MNKMAAALVAGLFVIASTADVEAAKPDNKKPPVVQPVITSVEANLDDKTLRITGDNFADEETFTGSVELFLAETGLNALVVDSLAKGLTAEGDPFQQLVVSGLPANIEDFAGTHLLVVRKGDNANTTSTFPVTIGAVGPAGADGIDGTNGINGVNGINGTNGENGADGQDGADGTNGIDGTNGKDGVNGENGTDGADGNVLLGGMKIIRGTVAADGTVLQGSGFTVSRTSPLFGDREVVSDYPYVVTFDDPFVQRPVIVATSENTLYLDIPDRVYLNNRFITLFETTKNGFIANSYFASSQAYPQNCAFSFIAIGE